MVHIAYIPVPLLLSSPHCIIQDNLLCFLFLLQSFQDFFSLVQVYFRSFISLSLLFNLSYLWCLCRWVFELWSFNFHERLWLFHSSNLAHVARFYYIQVPVSIRCRNRKLRFLFLPSHCSYRSNWFRSQFLCFLETWECLNELILLLFKIFLDFFRTWNHKFEQSCFLLHKICF